MAVKKNVLLVLIIFIFLFSIQASFANAQGCCLAPYDNGYDAYYLDPSVSESECFGSFRWVDDGCFDLLGSGQIVPHVDDFAKGCCCNDVTQTANSFGGSGFETEIFEPYCNSLNDGTGDSYTFVNPVSGTCQCGAVIPEESFYSVSGTVLRLVDNTPLSGIKIQLLDDSNGVLMETTSTEGTYSFSNLPAGQNSFRAFSPIGHDYVCIAEEQARVITSDVDDLNFVLSCEENQAACEPDWHSGSWGECVPYTVNGVTSLVQFRDVVDLNNCSTSLGQPTNVNTTACEGEVSFGTCGNGILDGFEQCDYDNDTGTTHFKDLFSEGESSGALTCGDFYLLEPTDPIGCTYTCTYDTSTCTPACDDTCDRISECGVCPSCNDKFEVCGNPCDDTKPIFLNEMDKSIRDVFNLYKVQQESPELYTSQNIKYFEGTHDVELAWSFNDSCMGNILAFKASICQESDSNPNHCGLNGKSEAITTDLQARSLRFSNVLTAGTTYCYNVAAINLDGSNENWAYNESEELPCFTVGSEYCMDPNHEQGFNCVIPEDTPEADPAPFGCIDELGRTNLSLIPGDCLGDFGYVGAGNICVETEYDLTSSLMGAECRKQSKCNLCNGLFGLYANHNLESFYFPDASGNPSPLKCNDFLHQVGQNLPTYGLCFKDKSDSVDVFDYCSKVTSCYDYKSADSCGEDYCNKFTNRNESFEFENSCEWNYYNEELGIGICKPKEQSEEDCFKCDSYSPLGFCDESMCELYGDCYFKDVENHADSREKQLNNLNSNLVHYKFGTDTFSQAYTSTCVHKKDMGCFFYDTQEDCEGANGPASIDVSYRTNYGPVFLRPIYGTNEQLVFSDDVFGFGDCVWNDDSSSIYYGCNKNSDNFNFNTYISDVETHLDDCSESSLGIGFEQPSITNKLDCFSDNEPPITNLTLRDPVIQDQYISQFPDTAGNYLPVYGTNEIVDLVYEVNDSVVSSDEIATFFSFVSLENCTGCIPYDDFDSSDLALQEACYDRGCELYPQRPLERYSLQSNKDAFLHHGEHLMMYYSEDSAHNLEVVQYKPIFIDAQGPEFEGEFNYTVKSFLLDQEDVYASNLTISFQTSEPALCSGTLKLGTKTHPVGDIYSYDTDFSTFYPWLPDGYYTFEVRCLDDYQNELAEDFEIVVEGDKSITNPLPRGGVYTTIDDVRLSIETPHEATCHLSSVRQPFDVSPLTFSNENVPLDNGRLEHSVDYVDSQFNAVDVSGTHVYFTSCDFGNGNITEMKNGDTLSFTIDKEAPETSIYASTTGRSYQSYDESTSEWSPVRYMKLMCDDDNTLTPVDNFHCKEIHWCIGEPIGSNESFNPLQHCVPINGARYMSVEPADELELQDLRQESYSNKLLYYYSVDNGGNREDLKRVNLRLRDVEFDEPIFQWVEPNTLSN